MNALEDPIVLFIKFGSEENIKSLYENGIVYLNTIEYFQNLEDKGVKGDKFEGTHNIKNYESTEKLRLEITDTKTGDKMDIKPSKLQLRHYDPYPKGNLYSLYCIKRSDFLNTDEFTIDSRVKAFGSHALFIRGTKKFIDKLTSEIEKLNMAYKAKPVEYYDNEKTNGQINLFQKIQEYKYQNEYRVIVQNNSQEPIKISIGSLKDYSEMFALDSLDDLKIVANRKK